MGGRPVVGPYLQKVVVGGTRLRQPDAHPVLRPARRAPAGPVRRLPGGPRRPVPPARPDPAAGTPSGGADGHVLARAALHGHASLSVVVFGVVVALVLGEGGANLDAPADPSSSRLPARPEWYFLSLFQMLKFFPGKREVIGTIVIPTRSWS